MEIPRVITKNYFITSIVILLALVWAAIILSDLRSQINEAAEDLSNGPRAFAIFTLPFQESNTQAAVNGFTISDYNEAMNIVKSYINSSLAFDGNQVPERMDTTVQTSYIIQSIRVLVKNQDLGPAQVQQISNMTISQSQRPFEILEDSPKMITIQSLDNITSALEYSRQYKNVTHILYDIEHWPQTPQEEQESPIQAISEGSRRLSGTSIRYGITPDAPFLLENYQRIQWTEVDFLGMQLQRFSQNITAFSAYAKEISTHVKAANPSTVVFVQLSFRFTDSDEMIEAIERTRPWVDGYIVSYLPTSAVCLPDCNPQALRDVLERIQNPAK